MALCLRAAVDVRAPAALVFALLSTPERLPEWNPSITSARRTQPEAPVALGSRAVFSGRLLGQPLETETEVVRFEPPNLFCTRALRGPRLQTSFELQQQPWCTRVELEVSGEVPGGRLAAVLAEGFLRNEFNVSLDRLKLICEREAHLADERT